MNIAEFSSEIRKFEVFGRSWSDDVISAIYKAHKIQYKPAKIVQDTVLWLIASMDRCPTPKQFLARLYAEDKKIRAEVVSKKLERECPRCRNTGYELFDMYRFTGTEQTAVVPHKSPVPSGFEGARAYTYAYTCSCGIFTKSPVANAPD